MENKKSSTNKIIIAILIALLIGAGVYSSMTAKKLEASNTFLEEEKVQMGDDMDVMVAKYDTAINENSSLSGELKLEREDIILFRDSVKNLKNTNWSIIRRYRKKIATLEASNYELFRQNDSLRVSNQFLATEIDSAQQFISRQGIQLNRLNSENSELIEKIGIGAKLQVNSVQAISMRKRYNGKFKETSRARRTDAFRISFKISENYLAEKSSKEAIIQILDEKNEIVHYIGTKDLANGTKIKFTDKAQVVYSKTNLDVISFIEVDRKLMSKGIHTINIYLEDRLAGSSQFTLK